MKEIGQAALERSCQGSQDKKVTVKLNTFHTQNKKGKDKSDKQAQAKNKEVTALLRITQIAASGGNVDIIDFIGKHECANVPPSIFDDKGDMRSTKGKSALVKALLDETGVQTSDDLPTSVLRTSIVVDAMFNVRKWSFEKDVPFPVISNRYRESLVSNLPRNTSSVHFCCDRYNVNSLKSAERKRRATGGKVSEVNDQLRTPDPKAFFE